MPKEWSIKIVFESTSARLLVGVTTTITVASDITSSSVKSDHECKRRNADLAAPRLPAVQLTRERPGIVEADLRCRRTRLIREGCPTRHAKGFPDRSPRLRSRPRPPNGRRSQGPCGSTCQPVEGRPSVGQITDPRNLAIARPELDGNCLGPAFAHILKAATRGCQLTLPCGRSLHIRS